MRRHPRLALGAAAALAVGAAAWALHSGETSGATYLGRHVWAPDWDRAGGYSALWLGPEGRAFLALSDRGFWVEGRLSRDADGVVAGVEVAARGALPETAYGVTSPMLRTDAEALAVDAAGAIFVAFEGHHRIMRFPTIEATPKRVIRERDLPDLPHRNRGMEALAVTPDGALLAIAESAVDGAYVVLEGRGGVWRKAVRLPAPGRLWKAVGADVGPDERLYLLERAFLGIGFRTRVRSFALDGSAERRVLETRLRRHDNLEGIHLWHDAAGRLRLTMLSDDNLRPWLQETEFVDYVVE
jgi:hypothetical protein